MINKQKLSQNNILEAENFYISGLFSLIKH